MKSFDKVNRDCVNGCLLDWMVFVVIVGTSAASILRTYVSLTNICENEKEMQNTIRQRSNGLYIKIETK